LNLTAIAKTERSTERKPGASQGNEWSRDTKAQPNCVIVESAADQPWTEFCRTLTRPAFLLAADSAFGDLEQS
jgi:hypothetical protein